MVDGRMAGLMKNCPFCGASLANIEYGGYFLRGSHDVWGCGKCGKMIEVPSYYIHGTEQYKKYFKETVKPEWEELVKAYQTRWHEPVMYKDYEGALKASHEFEQRGWETKMAGQDERDRYRLLIRMKSVASANNPEGEDEFLRLSREMSKAADVGDWDTYNKLKQIRGKIVESWTQSTTDNQTEQLRRRLLKELEETKEEIENLKEAS